MATEPSSGQSIGPAGDSPKGRSSAGEPTSGSQLAAMVPLAERMDPQRILVIDDDAAVLRYIARSLKSAGYLVDSAADGLAGVAMARKACPDLVVCDISMPLLDGHEVLRQLREFPVTSTVPFIFLTGRGDRSDVRQGMQLGADDYLSKPFVARELVEAVGSRLARRRQQTEIYQHQIEMMMRLLDTMHQAAEPVAASRNRMLERVALEREIERLLGASHGVTRSLPLAILRIKDSDRIYAKLGHAGADELLQMVEQRLLGALAEHPELHAIGNLGVQRSALLFVPDTAREQAVAIAKKVLESVLRPYHVRGKEVFVQFCAGFAAGVRKDGQVAASQVEALDPEPVRTLLLQAEAAVKAAKVHGCACVEEYRDDMPFAAVDATRLEADLHYAVGKGQLRLVYQPQVDLVTDEIVGFEALVRWQHPELGVVSPTDFIQLAEENGTILSIGEWVLREACTQMAEWQRQRMPIRRIAVNVSAVQFMESDLVATTAACLAATGLPGSCLQLEITESAIVHNVGLTQRIIAGLQALGVTIAIDDFGVGYSSLAYLRQLRFDELKIDRSFVQNMENEPEKLAIVDLILGLAERMGFQVTAEGIENQAVRSLLAGRRCRHGQGYYFARPMAPESIHTMLAALGHGPRPQATEGSLRRPRPFTASGMASVVNPSSSRLVAPSQSLHAWPHQQTLFGS